MFASDSAGIHRAIVQMMLFFICLALCLIAVHSFSPHSLSICNRNYAKSNKLSMISHGMGFNTLGRPADQRKALLRALTTEVIRHGRIRTTVTRAKEMRKRVDHMITLAKRGTLHARRQALAYIYDKDLVASLFESAPGRYGERNGGYCRVIREPAPRKGDSAEMAIIELV